MAQGHDFTIICDYIYIIEGENICFRCGEKTKVIGYGLENYCECCYYKDEKHIEYHADTIYIASYFPELPKYVLSYIQSQYNYKPTYSKFVQRTYMANRCERCGVLQGDFFLFHEAESPFFITDSCP